MNDEKRASVSTGELRAIGLFGAISEDVLAHLASTLTVAEPAAGEIITRDHPTADEIVYEVS